MVLFAYGYIHKMYYNSWTILHYFSAQSPVIKAITASMSSTFSLATKAANAIDGLRNNGGIAKTLYNINRHWLKITLESRECVQV